MNELGSKKHKLYLFKQIKRYAKLQIQISLLFLLNLQFFQSEVYQSTYLTPLTFLVSLEHLSFALQKILLLFALDENIVIILLVLQLLILKKDIFFLGEGARGGPAELALCRWGGGYQLIDRG